MHEIKEKNCDGIIIKMEKSTPCFITITVQQEYNIEKLSVCECGPGEEFFSYAAAGDRIKKEKGKLLITITKAGRVPKEFSYPYCLE